MKLTKTKLKQLIKEELENLIDPPEPEEFNETKSGETHEEKERAAIAQMKDLMLNAHKLYNELSKDVPGKKDLKHLRPFLIKNFEEAAQRWKEDMQGAEEEYEEEI